MGVGRITFDWPWRNIRWHNNNRCYPKAIRIRGGFSPNYVDEFNSVSAINSKIMSSASSIATSNSEEKKTPKLTSKFNNIFILLTSTEKFFSNWISPFAADADVTTLLAKLCSYSFWAYLTMCILGTIGIDTKPFLTFLNIALITAGFAAKDLITNSFSGIFILLTRPFSRGDVIKVGNFRGRAASVDIRYVKLVDPNDGSEIIIPLSTVYNSPIIIERNLESA